jgi:hypothetical protein
MTGQTNTSHETTPEELQAQRETLTNFARRATQ